jgi:hypothetical protein
MACCPRFLRAIIPLEASWMDAQWQFLLTELMVACAAITTLLVILSLVFWMERRTPGPVFSHQSMRDVAVDRESLKYHDAEREDARLRAEAQAKAEAVAAAAVWEAELEAELAQREMAGVQEHRELVLTA